MANGSTWDQNGVRNDCTPNGARWNQRLPGIRIGHAAGTGKLNQHRVVGRKIAAVIDVGVGFVRAVTQAVSNQGFGNPVAERCRGVAGGVGETRIVTELGHAGLEIGQADRCARRNRQNDD